MATVIMALLSKGVAAKTVIRFRNAEALWSDLIFGLPRDDHNLTYCYIHVTIFWSAVLELQTAL
jgi:hypothetical protein